MSDTSTIQPLVWLLMWHGASGSCCTLPGLPSRQVSVQLFSKRISGCMAPLRQWLAGDWKHGSLGSCSHMAACASSCACRGLIAIPSAPLSHACKRNLIPCTPAPEQGEHRLARVTCLQPQVVCFPRPRWKCGGCRAAG